MESNQALHTGIFRRKADFVIPVVIVFLLMITETYSFLLFHTLAELFAIIVAITMSVVSWHTYPFTRNHFLTYLGIGYFWVACMDLMHTITYKGMGIFTANEIQATLEYWILSRYFEALLLLSAPLFLRHKLKPAIASTGFCLLFVLMNLMVVSDVLPELFIEGEGLKPFKINSEYIIIGILVTAGAVLYSNRGYLEKSVLRLLLISISFTVLAEFCFTAYISIYGNFNMLGHIAKFFSFWFIYLSIIRTTLSEPYQVMARDASTYNAIALPTILIDSNGIIHQANRAALTVTGISEGELINRHCHDLFHSRQLSQVECPICSHIRQSKPLEGYELEFLPLAKWQRFTLSPFGPMGGLRGLVHVCEDITERKEAEAEMRKLSLAVEQSPASVVITDTEGNIQYVNAKFEQVSGYHREDVINRNPRILKSGETSPEIYADLWGTIKSGQEWGGELRNKRKNGELYWETITISPIKDKEGRITNFLGINEDITERKLADEMLRRAQKMDAIGQLTGGIAHDFNNLLSIIIGNLGLLKPLVMEDEKSGKRLGAANKAALRAAKLTKQLLGFSRRQAQNTTTTDINQVIRDMDSLIARSVTPEVEVEYLLADNLWLTDIDPGDFEDALLNLIINARDAMPEGGRLGIETSNKILDEAYAGRNPSTTPGKYVQLAVSDTGTGMQKDVLERIFEPFFTTKSHGKGTGLGVSMVFGFTERSNGHIKAYSDPGTGTTFCLYLPHSCGGIEGLPQSANKKETKLPRGHEAILVVDDEEGLLDLAQEYLGDLGYQTVTAKNSRQALERLAESEDIDLLFTDVVMPGGMNGYELAEQAVVIRPEVKVLLTSGFTAKAVARNGQARFNAQLLAKPYHIAELARRIRKVLDEE